MSVRPTPADDTLTDQIHGLLPHWGEVFAACVLIILYLSVRGSDGATISTINIIGPAILSIATISAAVRMTQLNIHAIWSPLFAYRIAMGVYLGIGSLLPNFLNNEMRDLLEAFFAFYPSDVLRFNTINAVFHLAVLAISFLLIKLYHAKPIGGPGSFSIAACNIPLRTLGIIFLAVGMTANYLVVYPSSFGVVSYQVPSTFLMLGQLSYLGYFLLCYHGLRTKQRSLVLIVTGLAILDSILGMLMLSKSSAILPPMLLLIAYLYQKPSARRFLIVAAITIPYYYFASQITYEARSRVIRLGANNTATMSESISVIGQIVREGSFGSGPDNQLGWVRLSYVNAGTFAISRYDQGLDGDSMRDVFVVWIPRLIYPEKPVITDIGGEFNFMATGNPNSASSPTIPSEGYWDYGWTGVGLFAVVLSAILSLGSVYSTIVFERGAWHLMLPVLVLTRMGARIDGMFVPDVIGPLASVVVMHIVCQIANRLLPQLPAVRARLARLA